MPGQPFDIVVGPAARWAVVSLPSTRGPRRLAVLRLGAGRPARVVHTVRLGAGLQPFGLDLAGSHLFVAAGAGLLAVDVEPLVVRGRLVAERLATGAGLIGVDASGDGRTSSQATSRGTSCSRSRAVRAVRRVASSGSRSRPPRSASPSRTTSAASTPPVSTARGSIPAGCSRSSTRMRPWKTIRRRCGPGFPPAATRCASPRTRVAACCGSARGRAMPCSPSTSMRWRTTRATRCARSSRCRPRRWVLPWPAGAGRCWCQLEPLRPGRPRRMALHRRPVARRRLRRRVGPRRSLPEGALARRRRPGLPDRLHLGRGPCAAARETPGMLTPTGQSPNSKRYARSLFTHRH